ncbi:Tetratricopeptide (TPR) repeat [Nonomuraea solani]|uniref:Tetratricopeptide (TPR) repeat n=1 Tax=Nonomuraea solani TaxID=1144553 RepID=A0A1H6F2M1_9ACTN|nr:tetratricopeptide repeat protein [Nonomuraea solani]SEH03631.1 Tetratricopeptide (TPR) repeat [Nonomuraea solani]
MPLSGDPVTAPEEVFTALPDPAQASSFDDLVEGLRRLKVWAGDPSYETIKERVNKTWTAAGRPAGELTHRSTVAYCFRPGRRRLDTDLVLAVVQALHPDTGYVTAWRQALRVIGGEIEAVSQVRVQDSLPQDLAGFSGRAHELDRLRHAVEGGSAVVISAIEGMAGVGKTQLAVHAGHLLDQERPFDRVLFVNLRGFDPDPAQPPADPAAVLDGFLRLLGMSGQQIPHTLEARAAAYRDRLVSTRALVVLDNAATTEQVRPLLPAAPGCLTLVTSRRSLADLHPATYLSVDVFTPDEALAFLTHAVPGVPAGPDPLAAARIAQRCGYLPLALSLVAGHIRNTPGWTMTDHADRLDERHHQRRLDTGAELALHLSYQRLPADQRRLLRLLALHPGQDLDAYAAATLADADLGTVRALLAHLCGDHLLQQSFPGRYTFHDLVRAYATTRAADEDPPSERRTALTRLFDHYLVNAAAAMNTLYPAETRLRPQIPLVDTPTPDLTDPDRAREWLDTERPALVAVAAHTATNGWPAHAIRLSRTLYRYLSGGHHTDAVTVHGHAHHAVLHTGDPTGHAHAHAHAHALNDLGIALWRLGQYGPATMHLQQALALFRQAGDPDGQARTLNDLGTTAHEACRFQAAADHFTQAVPLHRQAGDRNGEARGLTGLGIVEALLGRHRQAANYYEQALLLHRQTGDRDGEAYALIHLGEVEVRSGRYGPASDRLQQALTLYRQLGNRNGECAALDGIGVLHTRLGRPTQAAEYHQRALTGCRESGFRGFEPWPLNGLGEAAHAAGHTADALAHHTAAHTIAAEVWSRDQQARAHTGLGHVHRALGNFNLAREHYQHALGLYTDLGLPEAGQTRVHLKSLTASSNRRQTGLRVPFREGPFCEGNR